MSIRSVSSRQNGGAPWEGWRLSGGCDTGQPTWRSARGLQWRSNIGSAHAAGRARPGCAGSGELARSRDARLATGLDTAAGREGGNIPPSPATEWQVRATSAGAPRSDTEGSCVATGPVPHYRARSSRASSVNYQNLETSAWPNRKCHGEEAGTDGGNRPLTGRGMVGEGQTGI